MHTPGLLLTLLLANLSLCDSGAVQLDSSNIDSLIQNNNLVFINFYADWCRFSNMLAPIWDQTADQVAKQFSDKKVVIGKVDCDQESGLGVRYHITKYPTIKYVQNGVLAKKEYRGQRSVESFISFVSEHIKDPISELTDPGEVSTLDGKKRHILGYFASKEGPEFENLQKLAGTLKEDCVFHLGVGETFAQQRGEGGANRLVFKPVKARDSEGDQVFTGSLLDYEVLNTWAVEKCSPLVREITFENAEELTEEGLPFLILFHHPDDTESIREYAELVSKELLSEKTNINFLTADGLKFAHPLHHLQKSKDDLPLLAIDSFRHMYLFPRYEDIKIPGRVKTFLQDLYSGKLHREFHYGPDQTEEKKEEKPSEEVKPEADEGEVAEGTKDEAKHIPREKEGDKSEDEPKKPKEKSTDPPESQFVHLGPSKQRYTIIRDEF